MFEYESIITRRQVLERFTEEEIFAYTIKDIVSLDRKYCSPCRADTNPGCTFFIGKYGDLMFSDFADPIQNTYDCFQLYAKTFNVPFECVYDHIWNNVEPDLYFSGSSILKKKGAKSKNSHIKNTIINILPKDWDVNETKYWKQYGITTDQLDKDKVIPLEAVMIETRNNSYSFRIQKMGFAYTDFDGERKKIYQPYNKEDKWFTNCNADDIGNIGNLKESGYFLIITKSYKDCRVIRNLGYNCIWFQNEGMCPNNDKLKELTERFEKILVIYDNDETGIIAGKKISERINSIKKCSKAANLPEKYLEMGIKDSSDLVKEKGYETLNRFIKSKLQK